MWRYLLKYLRYNSQMRGSGMDCMVSSEVKGSLSSSSLLLALKPVTHAQVWKPWPYDTILYADRLSLVRCKI